MRLAREQGLSRKGPDGLLKQFTKTVLAMVSWQTLRSGVKLWGAVGRVDVVVPMVR